MDLRMGQLPLLVAVLSVFALGTARDGVCQSNPPDASAAAPARPDEVIASFRRTWQVSPGYMRSLEDPGWKARMVALSKLARLDRQAVPALAQLLEDEDAEVRVFASQALGFLGDRSVLGGLERVLAEDSEAAARLYAADALGMIGGMRPKNLYTRAERQDPNTDVRAHVRFALERKGKALSPKVREELAAFDPARLDTARTGKPAPAFALRDALGKTYRLQDFRGKQALVLVFIYGDT